LSNASRTRSNAAKSEQRRDQGKNKKGECPGKHDDNLQDANENENAIAGMRSVRSGPPALDGISKRHAKRSFQALSGWIAR
jgi:hypothetical protein